MMVRQACLDMYQRTGLRNYFLLYAYSLANPHFLQDRYTRGIPNRQGYQDSKGLLEVLVNRLMVNGAKNSGKKARVARLVEESLTQVRQKRDWMHHTNSWLLAMALTLTSPDRMLVNSRYGSGVLTKAVWMTYAKRINWFILMLTKQRKCRNFAKRLAGEIELALDNSPKSVLWAGKKQVDAAVAKANIRG